MNRTFGETCILTVDLSFGETRVDSRPRLAELFLGGRGVNQSILLERGVDRDECGIPRRLVFGPGSLVGTSAPSATRSTIDSGNMYNAGIGSGSIGGRIGLYLRFSGYDHVVLEGRANAPRYLLVTEGRVSLLDASGLWGRTIEETDNELRRMHGREAAILYIGPAGENLVRTASISSDKFRTQGRCGLGMILGAMRLKAIVVPAIEGIVDLAAPDKFTKAVDRMLEKIRSNQEIVDAISTGGLACTMDGWLALLNPVRNFQDGYLSPERQQAFSGAAYTKYATHSAKTSHGCPVNCDVIFSIPDGPYAGTRWAGVEGNVQWDFGAKLDISDITATIKLHALCTNLGLDTDSTSTAISWAFECYQRGILTKNETDGLALEWGNAEVVIELIHRIAQRDGIGDLLADGCKKASEKVGKGSEAWAIHVKGQDLAEPLRAEKGWALGCVVSPRAGGHTRGAPLPFCTPPLPEPYDPTAYEGQPERVVRTERLHAVQDCLGLCNIPSQWVNEAFPGLEDYAQLYGAASGKHTGLDNFLDIAEDAVMLEKLYNQIHAGFDRSDDYPPPRFMREPLPSGPMRGQRLSQEEWDKMLDEYYQLHKWDKASGKIAETEVSRILGSIKKAFQLP